MTKDQLLKKLSKWHLFYHSCVKCARADQAQELAVVLEEAAKYVSKAEPFERGEWSASEGMQTPKFKNRHFCSKCGSFALNDILGREVLSDCCPHCGIPMSFKFRVKADE